MFSPNLGRWVTMDPVGYSADDPNLYGYVANNPIMGLDPSGLADATVPSVEWNREPRLGYWLGIFNWTIPKVQVPDASLKVLTHLDIRLNVSRFWLSPPTRASYEFWFEGQLDQSNLRVNLTPAHGSHNGPDNKVEPWPIFDGKTRPERLTQRDEYYRCSLDTLQSKGSLTVRVEYRGYKAGPAEQFKPKLGGEWGGPVTAPALFTAPSNPDKTRPTIPNWFREFAPRTQLPWLGTKPAIWSEAPKWSHTITMNYTWDGRQGGERPFTGQYTLVNGGGQPQQGNTPGPDLTPKR